MRSEIPTSIVHDEPQFGADARPYVVTHLGRAALGGFCGEPECPICADSRRELFKRLVVA